MIKSFSTGKEPVPHLTKTRPIKTFGPPKKSISANNTPKSLTPVAARKEIKCERRSHSLSPTKQPLDVESNAKLPTVTSVPASLESNSLIEDGKRAGLTYTSHNLITSKAYRLLATKKRDFFKLKKNVLSQQNQMLEQYATLKELESRMGCCVGEESLGEVRILSVTKWPYYDLLLLVRDDIKSSLCDSVGGVIGPEILHQINSLLSPVPGEVVTLCSELLNRRYTLLSLLRNRQLRSDRPPPGIPSTDWKLKISELDAETEELQRNVEGYITKLKEKIQKTLNLAKTAWIDRDAILKKLEKSSREVTQLHSKLEDVFKKPSTDIKQVSSEQVTVQTVTQELYRERAQRESLKEMLAAAENMLRASRAKVTQLERHLKDMKMELENSHRKQKDLEQIYRYRENNIDARSKKLLEVSKTGEMTIEQLSRQRDALELRIKELRESWNAEARVLAARHDEQRVRAESLHAKVARQGKDLTQSQQRTQELEARVKELEEKLEEMRTHTTKLVDLAKLRCVDYLPAKEHEPSERETETWKELQVARAALATAEDELKRARVDKDSFLNSLSRIASGEGANNLEDKMATELLESERKISKLQQKIREHEKNEKTMEQSMTQYENQLAGMKLEIRKLRGYYHYIKEVPQQELHAELLELQMQVSELSSQRAALVSAAASRALMLERHERAAACFAALTRTRRELAALTGGRDSTTTGDIAGANLPDVSISLVSLRAVGAETWSALKVERARVLSLERAVLSQNLQLEREGRVRTQLERRRAFMERELMWPSLSAAARQLNKPSVLPTGPPPPPEAYNPPPATFNPPAATYSPSTTPYNPPPTGFTPPAAYSSTVYNSIAGNYGNTAGGASYNAPTRHDIMSSSSRNNYNKNNE